MNADIIIAFATVLVLFALVLSGVQMSFSLMGLSFIGIWLITGNLNSALSIISTTSFNAIRTYTYCVVPLFMLMGTIMAVSGSARDLFKFSHVMLKKIPGGLAAATVVGNAIFAAVTGVSIASATVFSQVAIPEMKKYKYDTNYATGIVCSSSVLGMLIPPSLYFIVYGTVAQVSIGKLFVGGILPGLLMATIFIIYACSYGWRHPEVIGMDQNHKPLCEDTDDLSKWGAVKLALPIGILILIVLGGIWGGYCTPTEASAIGCTGAIIVALSKKAFNVQNVKELLLDTNKGSASILLLLISAQMYSRLLSVSGAVNWISASILSVNIPSWLLIALFLLLVLALGCVLDGNSIILLTVPIIQPIVTALGFDPVWWGVILVMAVCVGMITPPFGLVIFACKNVLGDEVDLMQIFKHSTPYVGLIVLTILLCMLFPSIVTVLPNLM